MPVDKRLMERETRAAADRLRRFVEHDESGYETRGDLFLSDRTVRNAVLKQSTDLLRHDVRVLLNIRRTFLGEAKADD